MNTEELEQTNLETQKYDTANLLAVSLKRQMGVLKCLYSSPKTNANQREHHRNPESCLLTSLGASSERENSGFSI